MDEQLQYLPAVSNVSDIAKKIVGLSMNINLFLTNSAMMVHPSLRFFSEIPGQAESLISKISQKDIEWNEILEVSEKIYRTISQMSVVLRKEFELDIVNSKELDDLNYYSSALFQVALSNSPRSDHNLYTLARLEALEKQDFVLGKFDNLDTQLNMKQLSINALKEKIEKAIFEEKRKMDSVVDEMNSDYKAMQEKFASESNKLNKLREELSSKALTGGFARRGQTELWTAEGFRVVVLLIMAFTIFFLYHLLKDAKDGQIGLDFIPRISFVLALLLPASYLAREAGKHRALGNRYLQTGLYLATLDPYMASMATETREKVKVDLASKMFFSFDTRESSDSMPINTQEVIMKAMDLVSKSAKK